MNSQNMWGYSVGIAVSLFVVYLSNYAQAKDFVKFQSTVPCSDDEAYAKMCTQMKIHNLQNPAVGCRCFPEAMCHCRQTCNTCSGFECQDCEGYGTKLSTMMVKEGNTYMPACQAYGKMKTMFPSACGACRNMTCHDVPSYYCTGTSTASCTKV